MDTLPNEVIGYHILPFLGGIDFLRFRRTCKRHMDIVDYIQCHRKPTIWRRFVFHDFPRPCVDSVAPFADLISVNNPSRWRDLYAMLFCGLFRGDHTLHVKCEQCGRALDTLDVKFCGKHLLLMRHENTVTSLEVGTQGECDLSIIERQRMLPFDYAGNSPILKYRPVDSENGHFWTKDVVFNLHSIPKLDDLHMFKSNDPYIVVSCWRSYFLVYSKIYNGVWNWNLRLCEWQGDEQLQVKLPNMPVPSEADLISNLVSPDDVDVTYSLPRARRSLSHIDGVERGHIGSLDFNDSYAVAVCPMYPLLHVLPMTLESGPPTVGLHWSSFDLQFDFEGPIKVKLMDDLIFLLLENGLVCTYSVRTVKKECIALLCIRGPILTFRCANVEGMKEESRDLIQCHIVDFAISGTTFAAVSESGHVFLSTLQDLNPTSVQQNLCHVATISRCNPLGNISRLSLRPPTHGGAGGVVIAVIERFRNRRSYKEAFLHLVIVKK